MKTARTLLALFLLSFGITLLAATFRFPGTENTHVRVQVASGQDLQSITENLRDQDVIRSALLFRLYLQFKGFDTAVKPGEYVFPTGSSYAEIANMLVGPSGQETVVTIPEGYTVADIDALLTEMQLISEGEILHCAKTCDFSTFDFLPPSYAGGHGGSLEGYLFPDTYFVSVSGFVPKFFLERLLSTFEKKVITGLSDDLAVSERSLHEIVTMGTLIERETRANEERPVVSGILWKRYDSNRGLDVDATLRYGLQKWDKPLTKDDLQNRHSFNTRRHVGLPPGPIANAGLQSIQAALEPQHSDYWYYLHGKDGKIRYAETNDEHNLNKAKYL